jgi:hypothetical protein
MPARTYARPSPWSAGAFFHGIVLLWGTGCTGLVAGPESSSVTPVPASRDTAYVRARRALQGESFTLDLVDSVGGRVTATRYPNANAQLGSAGACRMMVQLQIRGDRHRAEIASTSRWLAPEPMIDKAPKVCEDERVAVLERVVQVLVPPAP